MSKRKKPPLIKSQGTAIALGMALLVGAAWAFDQAFEARGKKRPLVARSFAI
jgi:hypothetical protein